MLGVVGEVVDELSGCAAGHEVTVAAAPPVAASQPGIGLCLELADSAEMVAVKRWTPAFLQHGALEPFTHRVVVR